MIINDISPGQNDLAVCSNSLSIDFRTPRQPRRVSVYHSLKKPAAGLWLALMGLMLTPVVNAATFTNMEGDEYEISSSRIDSASYSGGSNTCDNSWKCMTTYQNGQITNNTVTFQDAENIHFGSVNKSGVLISNKFFIPNDGKFIRKLVTLYNPTGSSRTLNYVYNLDRLIVPVRETSSGDTIATTADTWAVLEGQGTRPYYVTHWGNDPEGLSAGWFYTFNHITIPAGETLYAMYFTAVEDNLTAARNTAQELDAGTAYRQYEGLTNDELVNGINYDPVNYVSLSASELIAEQGSTAVHTLTVTNDTAGDINFDVSVNNSPQWDTTPSVSSIFVPTGGSTTFDVSVDVPVYADLSGNSDQAQILISGGGVATTANVTTRTVTAQLTDRPSGSSDFKSALSADGEVIVFHSTKDVTGAGSNIDGSYEVFRIDSDGTGLMQLTSSGSDSYLEGVNEDGSQIVYSKELGSGMRALYVMDGSGNNVVYLHDTVDYYGEDLAKITVDGNRVVFAGFDADDGTLDIFMINSDGTGLMQLTDIDTFDVMGSLSISSAGDIIVFHSTADLDGQNSAHNIVVYTIDANGENLRLLSDPGVTSGLPSISGNGEYVSYTSNVDGLFDDNNDQSFEVYRVRVDSSERVQLTATNYDTYISSLSYDGSRVLVSSRGDLLGDGSNVDGTEEIFIINVDSGAGVNSGTQLQLTQSNRDSTTYTSNISADGERITFTSYGNIAGENPDFGQEIFISFLDGRVFDDTVFTGGIRNLISFGFSNDFVQDVIDDQFNGVVDDEQQLLATDSTSVGSISLQTSLLLFLFAAVRRLLRRQ